MDPNSNLAEQRRIAARLIEASDAGEPPNETDALRLAELCQALDEWIANGGFLPADWSKRA
jgi:hypothetical protein